MKVVLFTFALIIGGVITLDAAEVLSRANTNPPHDLGLLQLPPTTWRAIGGTAIVSQNTGWPAFQR